MLYGVSSQLRLSYTVCVRQLVCVLLLLYSTRSVFHGAYVPSLLCSMVPEFHYARRGAIFQHVMVNQSGRGTMFHYLIGPPRLSVCYTSLCLWPTGGGGWGGWGGVELHSAVTIHSAREVPLRSTDSVFQHMMLVFNRYYTVRSLFHNVNISL